ncbi:hypothetical protein FJY69_01270 [candidate division WOR-3 bacterium]|nr:hypothetical protein [candidate division WOR-3 bacterium]
MARTTSVGLACLLAALPGFTAELSIQGVNRAEFWAFFDSVYSTHTEDKLDLDIAYGDLNGTLGMFLYEPSKPWIGLRQPMRLLDYTLAYAPEHFEVLYGKYYQTFGKGLALRSYSDDDFRHYKSLHGLRGTAHLPLSTEVVLLGGRLRDIFFQENTYKVLNSVDTSDQVLGADLNTRPVSFLGFGGRYVRINGERDLTPKAFNEFIGGNASTTLGPVDVYAELCQRLGTMPGLGGRDKGLGYYLSATAAIPGYSLLGEYMDYDNLSYPAAGYHYNDPPTPIKSGVAIDRGVDELGFGVSGTATPIDPLYLEANYGQLYPHKDTIARRDTLVGVMEWEGKARYSVGTDWTFEAKFNHMVQQNIELHVAERVTDKPTVHVNYLLGEHTFAFEAEYNMVEEDTGHMEVPWKYNETALVLSYGWGDALLFTAGWQGVDLKLDRRYNGQQSWPMFETVWNLNERNILRVRLGAERGGYTCSGGVCRFESPFRGIKAQLISRF